MHWLLSRGRIPYLFAILALTALAILRAGEVEIEDDNASLNATDVEQKRTYAEFLATFGSDDILLLSVTDPHLLEPSGLARVDRLTRDIATLDGVERVDSLTNALELVHGEAGSEPTRLIAPRFDGPDAAARARDAVDRNPEFTGLLISADRRTAGLAIAIAERPDDHIYRARLIEQLRTLMKRESGVGVELHLTGVSVQKHDVSAFIARDQALLLPLAVAVLGAILAGFFRRVSGVLLPLAVTGITAAWTIGAYGVGGFEFNAITSLLPPVLLVLSLAVGIHVYQAWLVGPSPADGATGAEPLSTHAAQQSSPQSRGAGDAEHRIDRIMHAVREVRFPAFLCAVTTAQGFLSLAVTDIPAVRQFGIFAAVGVMLSFVLGLTLIPVALTFLTPPTAHAEAPHHRWLQSILRGASRLSTSRPVPVLLAFGALTTIAAAGIPLVRNNTDLVRFLKTDAPLYVDTMFIDEHLSGPLVLDFVVQRADDKPLTTAEDVRRLAAFETSVRGQPHVTGVTSVLAVLRQVHRAETNSARLSLPTDDQDVAYYFDLLEGASDQDLLRRLVSSDRTRARFSVRLHAIGTSASAPLLDSILGQGGAALGSDYRLVPTGNLYRVVRDSNRLVDEQVGSFGLAVVLVIGAIGLIFRSIPFTIVAIIPNIMPLIWTGGLMGFLGIDLSTGTAMIASAVLGLAVDDTIHYLVQYRRAYNGNCVETIFRTTTGVGAPVTITSVVLILGFWIGGFGSFKPTIYFSLLTGLTMITGAICDLLVLPACLVLMDRIGRRRGPQSGDRGFP